MKRDRSIEELQRDIAELRNELAVAKRLDEIMNRLDKLEAAPRAGAGFARGVKAADSVAASRRRPPSNGNGRTPRPGSGAAVSFFVPEPRGDVPHLIPRINYPAANDHG